MNKKIRIIFILFVCIQNIHALDIEITNMEAETFLNSDFNRTFLFVGGISAAGKIEFNDRLAVKEGLSLGLGQDVTIIKLFTNAAYRIPIAWPIEAKLAWVYNGLPEFDVHSHAIAPIVSWNTKYYGASVGFGCRFTSFFGERALPELILPLGVYVNFINNEKILVGMSLANFNDFQADSFIAFALAAKASLRLNRHLAVINELEFRQSGVDGLTATFHGIVWKGGAKLTW
jgi:hypothetical protein